MRDPVISHRAADPGRPDRVGPARERARAKMRTGQGQCNGLRLFLASSESCATMVPADRGADHFASNSGPTWRRNLKSFILIGTLVALATGVAVGLQAALNSRIAPLIGDVRTGLLMNLLSGSIAALFVGLLLARQGRAILQLPGPTLVMLIMAGALGIAIITGIAFSFQRIGVAAGLASLILGQIVISIIVDASGFGGVEAIPLTPSRAAGVVIMLAAVYLMLPRSP
jgi:transporter family-2 protein